jgi:NADH-quinone oxidoreductase subunit K
MTGAPADFALYLASALFVLGLLGLLMRRNLIFMLLCLEIMFNAAGLAFVAAGARWGQADGQIFFVLILALSAADVAIALALVLAIHHSFRDLSPDLLSEMKG